jgi:hypothetical protein
MPEDSLVLTLSSTGEEAVMGTSRGPNAREQGASMKTIESAHANLLLIRDVPAQLAALETMNTPALVTAYRNLYGEPTRTRNVAYLRKRLGYRLQELTYGGLSASALEKIADLGDGIPERWRMRQAEKAGLIEPPPQPVEPRDPRIPPVGTILRRVHNGITHQVIVCAEGFDCAGMRFKTLSAVAKHITGTPWNGFLFFALKKPVDAPGVEESAA